MNWDYLAFECDADEKQALLKKHGAAGWRLHSCDPYVITGNQGIGVVHFSVVMDKPLNDAPKAAEPVEIATDGAPVIRREPIGGMRMKS